MLRFNLKSFNKNDHFSWSIDIYVNPTKATIIVVISTASILLIIGIVILYLHKKEKVKIIKI